MIKKTLISIVFLGNTLLFGQIGGSLKGKVGDNESGEGVAFANVQLEQNGAVVSQAVADIDGNYDFKSISPGKYDLIAVSIGFQTIVLEDLLIEKGVDVYVNVGMEASSMVIRDIIICEYKVPLIEPVSQLSGYLTSGDFFSSEPAEKKIDVQKSPVSAFNIYPNPFMDRAILDLTSDVDFKWDVVSLYDLSGNKVKDIDFSGNEVVIEREDLSAGTYIYQVTSESKPVATGRIVIQ